MVEAHQSTGPIQLDSDGVEAQLGAPGRVGAALGEPFAREPAQPALLARPDGDEGSELGVSIAARRDARLDLAENEAAGVGRDDVQLAMPGAEVGIQHGQAARLEVGPGKALAGGSQCAARVGSGHAVDATDGRATRV
jgi:hypothetical protein